MAIPNRCAITVLQNNSTNLNPRYKNSRRPEQRGSKPQAKAPPTRDTFAMNIGFLEDSEAWIGTYRGSLPFAGSLVESRLLGSSLAKTQQRPSSKDSKCGRKSLSKRPSKRPNNQPSKEGARRGRSEVRARAAAQGVQQPKMVAAIQSDITSAVPWAPVTALCTQQSQRSAVSTASRPRLLHTVQWSRASPGVL